MPASRDGLDSSTETSAKPREALHDLTARFTPGKLLAGRYRIISPLGRGGMGEVYRADDIRLGQPVALKFLPSAVAADSDRLERLVDEVRIGRQISHPNVCRLYDIAEAEGHHFLVMEYVDGEDLASLLRRIGRLPGDKALDIARGVCAGLAAAHEKGIIHRDLKPANVMIDGRGHARIADFGLAALAHSGAIADMSGTPQYMAPEQLRGGAASLRSDVYALGLVLHEMLTGKSVFEGTSLNELRALHADTKPPSLSSSATDVDPVLDRAIQRCLSRDPNDRPASARVVLASLPGGDPLQVALLAGETPSPEMVAAAGKVGDLRSGVAWMALTGGFIVLLGVAALTDRVSLFRRVPLTKSPEALGERAKEILGRLGYVEGAADSAYGFLVDWPYLDFIEQHDQSSARWDRLRTLRPGPLRFYYRQSPLKMSSGAWIPNLPWMGPPELGRITPDDPPLNVPGMTKIVLDTQGRLTSFVAVPLRFEPPSESWRDPDWSSLLAEADLDPKNLSAAAPSWSAWTDSDRKAAWNGVYLGQPDVPLHIEAAAFHGRPVYFEVQLPWVRPPSGEGSDPPVLLLALAIVFLSLIPIVGALIVLVRRNIRLGRGDRRGALKLALFTFGTLTLAQGFRADHTSVGRLEYPLLLHIISQGCYASFVVWSFYMALEPAVRRRWPHTLISWSRLMAGRFADPLVARDVMFGVLMGLVVTLVDRLGAEAPAWFGQPPTLGAVSVLSTLNAPRHVAYFFLLGLCLGVVYSLSLLFNLYLLRTLVRREWLAQLLLFAFAFVIILSVGDNSLPAAAVAAIFAGLVVVAVARFGLLCSAVLFFTFLVMMRAPLTLDWSAWYAGRSFAVLGFFGVLLAASAYLALGGKPLFGKALLDD